MKAEKLATFGMSAECVKTYALRLSDDGSIIGGYDEASRPDITLVQLAQQLASEQGVEYREALDRVMSNPANADVVSDYHKFTTSVERGPPISGLGDAARRAALWPQNDKGNKGDNGADNILLTAARKHMKDTGEKDLSRATHAVLAKDPELADAYGNCFTG